MSLSQMDQVLAWAHAVRAVSRDRRDRKHEPETAYIAELLAADDTCLHVGASEGRHARAMSLAAPRGQVFCFEPNSYSFAALGHFIRMHRLGNVEAINAAVSDAPGEVTLTVPIKTSGRAGRSFGVIGENAQRSEVIASSQKQERVKAITLDGFVSERKLPRVDFIRMDIEGAEALALAGGAATIDAHLPNILLEVHPISLKENFGTSAEAVTGPLIARGYRMFGLVENGLIETVACDPDVLWKDYFFIHPSRAARLPEGAFKGLMS